MSREKMTRIPLYLEKVDKFEISSYLGFYFGIATSNEAL